MATQHEGVYPWIDQLLKRRALVSDYCELYTQSMTFMAAVAEGYELHLMRFVTDVALVQAQMIIHEPSGISWSNNCVVEGGEVTPAALKGFMLDQKRLTDMGRIDVAIPTGRIEGWKASVAYAKRLAGEPARRRAERAQAINIQLEMEIERQIAARGA